MSVANESLKRALEEKRQQDIPDLGKESHPIVTAAPLVKKRPRAAFWMIVILLSLLVLTGTAVFSLYQSRNSEIAGRTMVEEQLAQKNQELEELKTRYTELEQEKADVEKQYNLESSEWQTAEKEYKDERGKLSHEVAVRAEKNRWLTQAKQELELGNRIYRIKVERLTRRIDELEKKAEAALAAGLATPEKATGG